MRKTMINAPIYMFDSIGCKVSILDGNFLIGQSLAGYNKLSSEHVGSYIPYLVRNNNQWEIGVGYVNQIQNNIIVNRIKVVKSSNENNVVNFNSDNIQFYIFANELGFNTSFHNVIVKNNDFYADRITSTYLLDVTQNSINATLPSVEHSENLVLEFKLISGDRQAYIRNANGKLFYTLTINDSYIRLVCDGSRWVGLNNQDINVKLQTLSEDNSFASLANAGGEVLSFQYNVDGTNLDGGQLYYGSGNKILFGDDSETTAHHIIPSSGNGDVVFNNDNTNTNFVIEGSGTRNLFFDYRGRLGLNIPSGSSPDTIFHIVNTTCSEGIRVENRSSCHPTNITLYYKPSAPISANTVVGVVDLAAKNSLGNQIDYVSLKAKALDYTAGTTKGQLDIVVATSDVAGTGITTITTNPDYSSIGYSDNNLTITKNSTAKLGYSGSYISANASTVTVQSDSINLNSSNIILGTGIDTNITVPTLYATTIQANNLRLQNISPSSVLSLNDAGQISAATSVVLPIPSGRILTTDIGGVVTGVYTLDDYFKTNQDIIWTTYEPRNCVIAIKQVVFEPPAPLDEFSNGDQVEIVIGGTKTYRNIQSLEITENAIVSALLNQNVTVNTTQQATIKSMSKGGVLSIRQDVNPGVTSDSTSNILSIRPQTDTSFNTNKKDIGFHVYGTEEPPALSIKANATRTSVPSGFFHNFASQQPQCTDCIEYYSPDNDVDPFPVLTNSFGTGLGVSYAAANFDYVTSGLFSGILTSVGTNGLPSFNGTYDQNGNAAEWIEDSTAVSTSLSQFVAGGSWRTEIDDNIGVSGLKNIESIVRSSGYDYVGFRVASQYSLVDNSNIANTLDMEFVSIIYPNNSPDDGTLYLYEDGVYLPIEIPNLGKVTKNYRIGQYEVTNAQYAVFLNVVATTNDRNLFKQDMTDSDVGGITRVGDGTDSPYEYSVKDYMEDKPVVFVDYLSAIRFINWLHHGAPLTGIADLDTILDFGAYDIFPVGDNTYLINKNFYQKYWLPNLNEWHKAAYFEARSGLTETGASAVMVRREDPYVINDTITPNILASLSVSGWLYVDHLIVGDNPAASSRLPRRTIPPGTPITSIPPGASCVTCNTTFDCCHCQICNAQGLCESSTDQCCVGNVCLNGFTTDSPIGGWNQLTETCDICNGVQAGVGTLPPGLLLPT